MVDFHGWEMPIRYGSIPDEHRQVRESAGIFDLCHMGRLEMTGPDADEWLQRIVTNDVAAIGVGSARYTLICNDAGTIIDDAIVYRLPDRLFVVVNASNRACVIEWIESHRDGADATLVDRTFELAMIAVQGQRAMELATPLFESPSREWDELGYYEILTARYGGEEVRVARTGYTGEDGVEVYASNALGVRFWRDMLEAGGAGGDAVAPIGLGARDTLRLEAGMALYGNDIDETTTPWEAGLFFAVKLDAEPPFIGRDALREARAAEKAGGPMRRLCGLRVESRRVARPGMEIYLGDEAVGRVTSGAPSPTLGQPIALAYLTTAARDAVRDGTDAALTVDLRGKREKVAIEPLPFFSRTRKKSTR